MPSGVPLVALDAVDRLALTVDGADEVAPNLDLIKGWGGALVRERIVAAASTRQVIVVGSRKACTGAGGAGKIPVEVVPFGRPLVERRARVRSGTVPTLRMNDGQASSRS